MIREKPVTHGAFTFLEYTRDGAETVYVLTRSAAEACRSIKNEDARWKCLKEARFAHRKLKPEEQ